MILSQVRAAAGARPENRVRAGPPPPKVRSACGPIARPPKSERVRSAAGLLGHKPPFRPLSLNLLLAKQTFTPSLCLFRYKVKFSETFGGGGWFVSHRHRVRTGGPAAPECGPLTLFLCPCCYHLRAKYTTPPGLCQSEQTFTPPASLPLRAPGSRRFALRRFAPLAPAAALRAAPRVPFARASAPLLAAAAGRAYFISKGIQHCYSFVRVI